MPRAAASSAPVRIGVRGLGSVDLAKMNKFAGRFGKGMVPVMGLVAIAVSIGFDLLFIELPFGGHIVGRLWYFTTALAFAAAGYGAAVTTRAGKGFVFTSAVVIALLYGAADIGLEAVLEGVTVGSALFLAVQGVVIAIGAGFFAARQGFKQRA
jgi:hypothetical protein